MPSQPFIVATAGHVDHGKSALVKALTGTDPDRLPEEKARGITIDLGFAHLELPAPPGNRHRAEHYACGLIDVPGHEDFVKNMVAGVGSVDLALLTVAADDLWMPQTEEHLQILLHLGVTRAVVALTKIDLAADPGAAERAIRARLADTPFDRAPIVPTSVISGEGLPRLRDALALALGDTPPPADVGKPRLWVDRVFVRKGLGTVVTGTLSGGPLSRGDSVVVQPGGRTTRIRSCQSHGRDVDRAVPGTRTALNLPDVPVGDTASGTPGVHRGDVVTQAALGEPTWTLDVVLEKSPRCAGAPAAFARPVKSDSVVRLHLGSANLPARVLLLQAAALAPGGRELAQLRLALPTVAFAGDRFILRDAASQATIAGGRVLDPSPPRTRIRAPDRLERLQACAAPDAGAACFLRTQLQHHPITRAGTLLVQSRFGQPAAAAAIDELRRAGELVVAGTLVASAASWRRLLDTAAAAIDAQHQAHPEQVGLPLAELRALLEQQHALRAGFEELVGALARAGFSVQGAAFRRTGHQPALPPALQGPGRRLRDALARQPLDPPSRRTLAPDPPAQQALRFLVQSGEAVEIGPDTVLTAVAYQEARDRIRALLERDGSASASRLRQELGTSRRILIPLLERLDREGFTVREGDLRRLRR